MTTLTNLRTEVREAVFEKATDTGLITSDTMLDRWINRANQQVWLRGLLRNPRAWIERTAQFAFPTTGSYALGSLVSPAVSDSLIWRLFSVESLESGVWKPLWAVEGNGDYLEFEEDSATTFDPTRRWYIEGLSLRLTPLPSAALTLRARLARAPVDMTANDEALGGKYPEHHQLVALKAAQLLYRRDEEKTTPWDREVEGLTLTFTDALRRNQGGITRRINRRRAY